jgi:dipeptidyl aminopeptidase/acylaminoacyl peptidase
MLIARIIWVVAAAFFLSIPSGADPLLIEAYAKEADISQIVVSPDGSWIAYMKGAPEGLFLIVTNVDNGESRKLDTSGVKARSIRWSGPNHVLLTVSETLSWYPGSKHDGEIAGVFAINIHSGKTTALLGKSKQSSLARGMAYVAAATWQEDGSVFMPFFVMLTSRRYRLDLMKVNTDTGYGESTAKGSSDTWDWIVTPDGHVYARVDYNDKMNDLRILTPGKKDATGTKWRTIYKEKAKTRIPEMGTYGGLSEDKEALILFGRFGNDRMGLHRMSLADGSIEKTVFEHPEVDTGSAIVNPYTGIVIGGRLTLDASKQVFFDAKFQKVLDTVRRAIPNQGILLTSWDKAENRFIIFSEGPGNSGTYYFFDVAKRKLMELAKRRPDLTPEHLSTVTPMHYTARDGLEIPAYLTLPPGASPKNLPLVVLPHGGPEVRDSMAFDYWAQALGSRGYAVLQMNFRGSSGYGHSFVKAGYGEWGGKMQDDIADGARHLIEVGIADPKRICIVGGSYGGYAALAGAVFTPDLYQCAVSINGISDLSAMMYREAERSPRAGFEVDYWKQFFGADRGISSRVLHNRSPVNFVDQVKASTLLIHGKDDTIVDIKQSKLMHKALKKADKDSTFVTLEGEDHWLSVESSRIEVLKVMEGFLAEHLGPATAGN